MKKYTALFIALVISISSIFSGKRSKDPDKFFRIAHRACSLSQKKIAENSLGAVQRALDFNKKSECIDGIEFDVRMTKDNKIVVVHNPNFKEVAGLDIKVSESTSSDIKKIRLKDGQQVAFFSDVISLINKRAIACIELKINSSDTEIKITCFVDQVLKEIKFFIKKGWKAEHFVLLSLDKRAIIAAKKIMINKGLDIETGILFDPRNKQSLELMGSGQFIKKTQALGADYAVVYAPCVTPTIIKEAKNKNVALILYPINTKDEVVKYKKMGARGFGADVLGCLKAVHENS